MDGQIIIGEVVDPIYENIKLWEVTEKIDGTNIRVMWYDGKLAFGGREDNAQIPAKLVNKLMELFTPDKFEQNFEGDVTLFGEGYGAGIQKGGVYRPDQSFILFDVVIHDDRKRWDWWLERENIENVAKKLGIEAVPVWDNLATFDQIEEYVMNLVQTKSNIEGVIAVAPGLMHRNGEKVKFKLKARDYI